MMGSPRSCYRPRMRLASVLLAALLSSACGPAAPANPPAALPAAPGAPAAPDVTQEVADAHFDPATVGMTPEGVTKLCDDHLALAGTVQKEIRALLGKPNSALTFESTLRRFDDMLHEVYTAESFPYLMAVTHPDATVREAAKKCEPKSSQFTTAMWLDADLAGVIKAYEKKGDALTGERKKFLEDTLRDFRRNGIELAVEDQTRLRELNQEITKIGQDFMSAIGASRGVLEVPPSSLEGLTDDYKSKHPVKDNGKVEISTDYPDYFPFVTYSNDREAALELYIKFVNRGGIGNVRLLERLLVLRAEKATLLGYKSWADYAIEPRMA